MADTNFVIAAEGDSVDLIAYRRYGSHGMEQAILEANPGLAALGPILPLGTRVALPAEEVKDRASSPRAWGK
jgi:phage tail protein X